jgi:hypothetical protein
MAAVMRKPRARLSRNGMIALAVTGALVGAYMIVTVYLQPLSAGPDEALYRAPGQTTVNDPAMSPLIDDAGPGRAPLLFSYVDGAEASLVKTLHNEGPAPITITGVETSPSYLTGALVTVKEAQPAAIAGPRRVRSRRSSRAPPLSVTASSTRPRHGQEAASARFK